MKLSQTNAVRNRSNRRGAVLPFFALLLPVIFVMCGLAINVSHLRLLKTEMKIATDASAHAGGRAMSIFQTTDEAVQWAIDVAAMNTIGGHPLIITDESKIMFGLSTRGENGYGRYRYQNVPRNQVDNGTRQANSVLVNGTLIVPLLFRGLPNVSNVDVGSNSISTQVDRDIALVLDRSGSMYWFESQIAWDNVFNDLKNRGKISTTERNNAKNAIWNTHYQSWSSYLTTNTWNKLFADQNRNDEYLAVSRFIYDWRYSNKAPRHSRWDQLNNGVDAFLDVLDVTDQEELVSLATFSSGSQLNYNLSLNYQTMRNFVANVVPNGSTAIGKGIQTGIPSIMTAPARPFAAKTIVVLTDGVNNSNPDPESVAQQMVEQYNITLHTVTFTDGADQPAMQEVARIGGGKHYHADTGQELIDIFEEIANNLPTILTY